MKPLGNKQVLMVIAQNNFRDEELKVPKALLEEQGAKVTIACSDLAISKGMLGMRVMPDKSLDDVSAKDYDAVIFVGGSGASEYFEDAIAHKLAQDALGLNKVLGAICIAPVTLANAGVLKGKKATVFSSEAQEIEAQGANYTGADVEQDGRIITANGPEAARKFGQAMAQALSRL